MHMEENAPYASVLHVTHQRTFFFPVLPCVKSKGERLCAKQIDTCCPAFLLLALPSFITIIIIMMTMILLLLLRCVSPFSRKGKNKASQIIGFFFFLFFC